MLATTVYTPSRARLRRASRSGQPQLTLKRQICAWTALARYLLRGGELAPGEGTVVGHWVGIDRRYNQPYRLTSYALRGIFKWTGLVLAWVLVNSALTAAHLSALILVSAAGLVWYAVHCALRNRRVQLAEPVYKPAMPTADQQQSMSTGDQWQLDAPPNWPPPPAGWSSEPGWMRDPSWPAPPLARQLWVPATPPARGAPGDRTSRVIPQNARSRCQCGTRASASNADRPTTFTSTTRSPGHAAARTRSTTSSCCAASATSARVQTTFRSDT